MKSIFNSGHQQSDVLLSSDDRDSLVSLGLMKTLELNFYECGEIEVIDKNRSIQEYLIIIIPKEVIFPIKVNKDLF